MRPRRAAPLFYVAVLVGGLGAGAARAQATENPRPAKPLLEAAMAQARRGHLDKACEIFGSLVDTWPDAPDGLLARFCRGRIREFQGDPLTAQRDYQFLVDHAPRGRVRDRALNQQREMIVQLVREESPDGRSAGARTPDDVYPLLEAALFNDPLGRHTAQLYYLMGRYHEQRQDYGMAMTLYRRVSSLPQKSVWTERAHFAAARCGYARAQAAPRDMSLASRTSAVLKNYLDLYPAGECVATATAFRSELEEQLAEARYRQAVFYEETAHNRAAAVTAYFAFLRDHADSTLAGPARLRAAHLLKDQIPLRVGAPAG